MGSIKEWIASTTIRWSDGTPASYRHDSVANALWIMTTALLPVVLIGSWFFGALRFGVPVALLATVLGTVAAKRLRATVHRLEQEHPEGPRGSTHQPASNRFFAWCIRRNEMKAEIWDSRAAKAAEKGDRVAAWRYRDRARKEREVAEKMREMYR